MLIVGLFKVGMQRESENRIDLTQDMKENGNTNPKIYLYLIHQPAPNFSSRFELKGSRVVTS